MLNHSSPIQILFQALGDPTRWSMVERLSLGPASVSELRPQGISLPATIQHLHVLEDCGLVRSEKTGRVRTCHLQPEALAMAEQWIRARRDVMQRHFDRLEQFLAETQPEDEKGKSE